MGVKKDSLFTGTGCTIMDLIRLIVSNRLIIKTQFLRHLICLVNNTISCTRYSVVNNGDFPKKC